MSTKRTLQKSKRRRVRKLGFRKKMSTLNGRKVIKKRRSKGRKRLAL